MGCLQEQQKLENTEIIARFEIGFLRQEINHEQ